MANLSKPSEPARLLAPTAAHIAAVTDVLEHRWSSNALLVQDRYTQAIERDDHNAASKWALAGAISTDKILVLKGRPTEIVGHVHAHRHELGSVFAKVAEALRPASEATVAINPSSPPLIPSQNVSVLDSHLPRLDAAQHGHELAK